LHLLCLGLNNRILYSKLLTVMKIRHQIIKSYCLKFISVIFIGLIFGVAVPVFGIAKGYITTDPELKLGMAAGLSDHSTPDAPKVERASSENESRIIGVTTNPDEELVTIGSGGQQVYVETTGEVDAYASDINGDIKSGNLLTVSPLKGVLMKADINPAVVVGIALEDFDASSAETKSVTDGGGHKDVKIAKLRVNLDHKAASNQQAGITDSSLRRLGRAITGREIGEVRVLIALIIFLAVLVAEGGIIYGAVSSALVALGRNPMARRIIQKEMVRVILIAVVVLLVGLAAIYLILWI